jgi:CheY-like chemotaxis protein
MTHILVVDDERIVAQSLQAQLERLGYAVSAIVSTGEEAVQKALELRPDVVLMDIMLRGTIDGVEAARRILAAAHIPIIFATACSDPETYQRAKATEPSGYLVKPFGKEELEQALHHALTRPVTHRSA